MSAILAIDLGGTNLRAAIARPGRAAPLEPVGRWAAPACLEDFVALIGTLVQQHQAARVGLAVPGLVLGTRCAWIPNLPWLEGADLATLVPDTPVAVGNDAHMTLLGEASAGAARGMADALLLAIGTGIGSAVLAGGRILRGAHGGATSFGWACADPDDPGDGRAGWLERQAAGRALDGIARNNGMADGGTLIARARTGDAAANALLDRPAAALGASLAGAVALTDPQIVIVAGGVAAGFDVIEHRVAAAMRRQLPPHLRQIEIRPGQLGDTAALAGAVAAAAGSTLWETTA
ncbi:ROK family protein [Nitratireductor sp. StC3]|uniref:ROK family protein n=1 Tax=Nitratireductor sp. StC3 TaxID=2126741 RepID=UPI000D0DB746|nr:ROK family protein [Nitratireductor sp. StC3]PSM17286.1 ROK family protein [Nitratireductor sp. StC3]